MLKVHNGQPGMYWLVYNALCNKLYFIHSKDSSIYIICSKVIVLIENLLFIHVCSLKVVLYIAEGM